jgi:competence protein ComFB
MEDIVEDVLKEIIDEYDDICKCDKCFLDIKACALNHLPANYVVTARGNIYTKLKELNLQFRTDVVREVVNAIKKIKLNPRH